MGQIQRLKQTEIQNGNVINANDFNSEFDQLVGESNSQDQRLGALESENQTITGNKTFLSTVTLASSPKIGEVTPLNVDEGVTLDGVICKEGTLITSVTEGDPESLIDGQLWFDADTKTYKAQQRGTAHAFGWLPKKTLLGGAPQWVSGSEILIPAGCSGLDSTGSTWFELNADTAVNLNTTGELGLDVGTLAADSWYYLYICQGDSGATVVASLNANEPIKPTGYEDFQRKLPFAMKTDSAALLIPFYVAAGWPYQPQINWQGIYRPLAIDKTVRADEIDTRVVTGGVATTRTAADCSAWLPENASIGIVSGLAEASANLVVSIYEAHELIGDVAGHRFWTNVNFSLHPTFKNLTIQANASKQLGYSVQAGAVIDIWFEGFTVTEL